MHSAQRRLEAARILLAQGYVPDAISRMYYGAFESAKALLLLEEIDPGTHAGTINQLGHHFRDRIETAALTRLRQDREGCDYELSRPPVEYGEELLEDAQQFVGKVSALLEELRPS